MQLLVVRHARAGDRDAFAETGRGDGQRPLTRDGRRRMREIARGLRELVPQIGVIATSPLVRAEQTARMLARGFDAPEPVVVEALAPGGYAEEVAAWLQGQPRDACVAVVGHEPDLGLLLTWLLSGLSTPFVGLKKGGACLLEFHGEVAPKRGELLWLATPRLLRARSRSR